eukprot:TRINITY_DN1044_c0_g3_i1.p1 TRINITY_DN1044_c0_g3~~TRINITY_DN1044_c0_g3_i1.p1  ORF type:complete len:179 (+),score=48.04 TRINITY_DN1044_c0_g3_i1:86-622(+)
MSLLRCGVMQRHAAVSTTLSHQHILHRRKLTVSSATHHNNHDASCIFCRIVQKEIPSFGVHETNSTYAFMDVSPLSAGHVLVIPKKHAVKMHELDDQTLSEILPIVKKVALATGAENYNILQNNGRMAHQAVMHVHYHIIPKPDPSSGLGLKWHPTSPEKSELQEWADLIKQRIQSSK